MTVHYDYDSWSETLCPCDLILIASPGFIGKAITIFESKHLSKNAQWVHAGVVCPENAFKIKNRDTSRFYIMESLVSGFDGIYNVETSKGHNGLQIRDLKAVVEYTLAKGGWVGCFHLKDSPFKYSVLEERGLSDEELNSYLKDHDKIQKLCDFWQSYSQAKYDCCNVWRAAGLCGVGCMTDTTSHMFCSEAVVRLYQKIGLVDARIQPELISPEELGSWCGDIFGDTPFCALPDILYATNPKASDC